MRAGAGITLAAALIAMGACAPDRRLAELEQRLQQVETERDGLKDQLGQQRAASADLAARATSESHKRELAQAESAAWQRRVESAEQAVAEYRRLIEQRVRQVVTRPAVPVSPLPAEVDQALLAFAERHAGRVWYDRARGAVSFANDRLFESGSNQVRAAAEAALAELAGIAALTRADEFEIIVVGHTDNTPIANPETLQAHPSNWHLSVHRAIAVKDVLVSAGLSESRLGVMGYGPYRPASEDKARNRRVEVFFVRRGEVKPFDPLRPIGR